MQKAVIASTLNIARSFKVLTPYDLWNGQIFTHTIYFFLGFYIIWVIHALFYFILGYGNDKLRGRTLSISYLRRHPYVLLPIIIIITLITCSTQIPICKLIIIILNNINSDYNNQLYLEKVTRDSRNW